MTTNKLDDGTEVQYGEDDNVIIIDNIQKMRPRNKQSTAKRPNGA
jgi:hypothetical protein